MENKKSINYQKIIFYVIMVVFILYTLSIIIPIVWMVLNTFKGAKEYDYGRFFPQGFEVMNYVLAFEELTVYGTNVVGMMFNSLWFAVGGAALGVLCGTAVAYCISKYRFWGRGLLSAIAIAVMIIPIVGALPSQYKVYDFLNMINSPLILLCFTSGFGMNYLVMRAAFDNLSWSYAEASFIDGAGHFRVFFQVMIPQVFPMLTALFLVAFIGSWNDYMSPLIFMPELPTLSTGLYVYEAKNKKSMDMSMPLYFTGVMLCLIPVFTLFMIFRNTIMDMSLGGGVKE
jgi:ABC-type glycerol-3-phosphate transport system permease component